MQRRAAAAYVAIFVVVAAGSYGMIATAQQPHVSLADSEVDKQAAQGGTFTVDGTTYAVSKIAESGGGGGGGHGGGGSATVQGTITWNATVEKTRNLANGSTVTADNTTWMVVIPNESDPSTFRLVENFTIDAPTTTQDGSTYVVVEGDDGNRTLVPRQKYLDRKYGEPRTREFSEGGAWNDSRAVANITAERAQLRWEAVEPQEVTAAEGANVTLGDTTYTAHFPSTSEMQLTTNYGAYNEEVHEVDRFKERRNGLWIVSILSGIVGVGLLALAYLPHKGD